MKFISGRFAFSTLLLLSTTLNAMEKGISVHDGQGVLVTTQEMKPLGSDNEQGVRSTLSILSHSFVYGVLEDVVQSTCQNFENVLHNLIAIPGI